MLILKDRVGNPLTPEQLIRGRLYHHTETKYTVIYLGYARKPYDQYFFRTSDLYVVAANAEDIRGMTEVENAERPRLSDYLQHLKAYKARQFTQPALDNLT